MIPWFTALALALAAPDPSSDDAARLPPPPEPENWQRTGWGFGGVPAVNFNSDEGFGFGVVGSIYRYDGEHNPYKTAFEALIFATSMGIHAHGFQLDTLDVGGAPLRLTIRGAFQATRTNNYCGVGSQVTCELPDLPPGAEVDEGRYFRTRFVYPNLRADLRYTLDPMPHRVELLAGWRGALFLPGDLSEAGPFPGTLYAQDFPDGERSRISVLQAGVMVDNRDHEAAPHRGYWVEGTVRGAAPAWGSTFSYFGFNATLRGYLPLHDRLVLADRLVLDGQVGDAPTIELATPGGSQIYQWYGSLNAGRGIRLRRYIGKVMAMHQTELRWTFADFKVAGVPITLTGVGFLDIGVVASEWDRLDELARALVGQGGGLRIALDRNFVVRADLGVSAVEGWTPSAYIDLRNTF